jgi:RHS repeat-associated protein
LIGETDQTGALIAEYVWIGDRPLAVIRNAGLNEAVYYFHADHLNTPLKITDSSGAVAWDVEFDPFGNELVGGLKTVENNLRFPGQYFDQESGLHYNYFRDYDPRTGRYIEPDPIGLGAGPNVFTYVGNSPANAIDPLGLYNLWDFGEDALGLAAGLGNAVSFGGTTWLAERFMSTGDVVTLQRTKRCSKAFKAGEWISLGLGAGRLVYAGMAKGASMAYAARGITIGNAAAASAFRNGLKRVFRLSPRSTFRVYPFDALVEKYGSAESIIEAAGRTDTSINIVGAIAATGGATTLSTSDDCECDAR